MTVWESAFIDNNGFVKSLDNDSIAFVSSHQSSSALDRSSARGVDVTTNYYYQLVDVSRIAGVIEQVHCQREGGGAVCKVGCIDIIGISCVENVRSMKIIPLISLGNISIRALFGVLIGFWECIFYERNVFNNITHTFCNSAILFSIFVRDPNSCSIVYGSRILFTCLRSCINNKNSKEEDGTFLELESILGRQKILI